jgi:addiction module RelB/DinJ family antitoxin
MQTILSVRIDRDVKEQAQALAAHFGIPLSTVIHILLRSFVESGELNISREPSLAPSVVKELNKIIRDTNKENRGIKISNTHTANT